MTKTMTAPKADASRRKSSPRTPSRGRGVQRFAALIDSVEALLTDASPDDVGLYQIAEHAGVPPASVYHFFPTKEAAFAALAHRYLEGFSECARQPIAASALASWQSLMEWDQRLAMEFYNRHPPAMKLFLGGYGGLETRQAEIEYNAAIAVPTYRRLDLAFHMPFLRDAERKFLICLEILDAVWAISFQKHGCITEVYQQEALDARIAYCRLFLPAQTELREEHRLAVGRGEPVVLFPAASRAPANNAEQGSH